MMPKTYRKKPIVIEAGLVKADNLERVAEWCFGEVVPGSPACIAIETLEGTMMALVGDYVIRGVKGEFYPCKPDIFDATYEPSGATKCEVDGRHVFENKTRFCMVCNQDFSASDVETTADAEER